MTHEDEYWKQLQGLKITLRELVVASTVSTAGAQGSVISALNFAPQEVVIHLQKKRLYGSSSFFLAQFIEEST